MEICYILQMTAEQKLFYWLGPKSFELCFGSDEFRYKYLTKPFELIKGHFCGHLKHSGRVCILSQALPV